MRYVELGQPARPTSDEERRQAREAMERLRLRRERLLRERGGRLFPDAAEIIRELRDEDDE